MIRLRPLKRFCDGSPQYGLNIAADQYVNDGLRFIRTTDVTASGDLTPPAQGVFIDPASARGEHSLREGDLLFSRSGSLGRCLLYRAANGPATFAGYLVRFRPLSSVSPRYLAYCAQTSFFQEAIAADAVSSTISNFNADRYASLRLPWWPETAQRAIADFLDAETARIDALITKKRQLAALLNVRFYATVDGKTESFERVPLRRVATVTYGLGQPPPLSQDGVPILRATNINRGQITSDGLIRSRLDDLPLNRAPLLCEGELLVVRSGAYTGDSARITDEWEGAAPGYDLRVQPNGIDSRLLAMQMLGRRFMDQVDLAKSRAAQPHLNAEDLGDITVMIGSTDAEHALGWALESLEQTRRATQHSLGRQVALLQEHRQALITAAVTGELEIPGAAA